MTPLKAQQERFCRRFAELACATTAARAAGYAPQWAKSAGYRRAIVDHQFHAAARAVDLQARIRGFTGAIPLAADADAECAEWPGGMSADGGRGSRPTACGDFRHAHRGGAGFGGS
jgi:hypothetical protein